jgi:hypothetical protein
MGEEARIIGATGGALGLSGFAAALGLCCTVPWAVALLGVSGAIAFARLAFLLPYALAGAVAMLALGFWSAYRKSGVCADRTCSTNARRGLRALVWISAAFVVVLAVVALEFRATI